jgi:hypothetical protein
MAVNGINSDNSSILLNEQKNIQNPLQQQEQQKQADVASFKAEEPVKVDEAIQNRVVNETREERAETKELFANQGTSAAKESENFTKQNVLAQAGSMAIAQGQPNPAVARALLG